MAIGVGVIGAGPGASALHVPTLARVADRFAVVHVTDDGSGRAEDLARRSAARFSTGTRELLDDPDVQVVAVCSPPHRHAEQVLAAVAAGKRAVFCEKPIALDDDDAESVVEACRRAGVPLVVGTNHFFDPAWERAKHHIVAGSDRVRTIEITAALPPNGRLHDLVTESGVEATGSARPAPDWTDPEIAAAIVRQLMLGLAVHDLPIVRDLTHSFDRIVFARPVAPIGYAIGFVAGEVLVQLTAVMLAGGADPLWRMTIGTSLDRLEVEFPPPFVHAGSAAVTVHSIRGLETSYPATPVDGYVAAWTSLADAMDGAAPVEYDEILEDARFAVALADAAAAAVRGGSS